MKAYRLYIALVLALALSGCGSVDSSEESSRAATTTTTTSAAADSALLEKSTAETTVPESEAETETSEQEQTTAATEAPAVTPDTQATAPTTAQTTPAPQVTTPAETTTTASPAPAPAAADNMDKLFETANAMYGKSLDEARTVFERAYGVSFGYAHEYSLGTRYETDDGDEQPEEYIYIKLQS